MSPTTSCSLTYCSVHTTIRAPEHLTARHDTNRYANPICTIITQHGLELLRGQSSNGQQSVPHHSAGVTHGDATRGGGLPCHDRSHSPQRFIFRPGLPVPQIRVRFPSPVSLTCLVATQYQTVVASLARCTPHKLGS
jgi:hypothetical protein